MLQIDCYESRNYYYHSFWCFIDWMYSFCNYKKRKGSAESIYKLIDDLEKKIHILIFFVGKKINQILYLLLLLNLSPNLEDEVQPNDLCYQYQRHLHNS